LYDRTNNIDTASDETIYEIVCFSVQEAVSYEENLFSWEGHLEMLDDLSLAFWGGQRLVWCD
jgi:hypothetical protein